MDCSDEGYRGEGTRMKHTVRICQRCTDHTISQKRWEAGYDVCLVCGEELAKQRKFCVAPMHKSNYMLFTNLEDLKGINKGGLVR